ncbi:MAG: hypothetical protein ABIR06_23815 [Cyclobacteriaceae bacterium]
MKKVIVSFIIVVSLLSVGSYYFYQIYFTDFIAQAFVSNSLPGVVPKRIQTRMKAISVPLNKGTEALIQKMHASDISIDHILSVVDNTTEEQAYELLDELNSTKLKNTNDVFDVTKKHIDADFNLEIFRKPFQEHFKMTQVRKVLYLANQNRKTHDVDFVAAKEIIKKILLEKEKEYTKRRIVNGE